MEGTLASTNKIGTKHEILVPSWLAISIWHAFLLHWISHETRFLQKFSFRFIHWIGIILVSAELKQEVNANLSYTLYLVKSLSIYKEQMDTDYKN